jgi:hypothetical protein
MGGDATLILILAAWCALSWLAIRLLRPYAQTRNAPVKLVPEEVA